MSKKPPAPDHELRHWARLGALETVRRAVAEFPDILTELNRAAAGLDGELARTTPLALEETARPRRRMSPAARRAISEAMRKRWAAAKKASAK